MVIAHSEFCDKCKMKKNLGMVGNWENLMFLCSKCRKELQKVLKKWLND